jgi:hypothetical protein
MSLKQALKRTGRRKAAATVLGAAAALSLGGGASAAIVGPAENIPTKDTASRHVITLSEEEVFDVSLATFYVFDKEDAPRAHPSGVQLAAKGGHGGCGHGGCGHGARGCGGCGHGCRGCRGCARGCGGCGGCGYGCGGGCCLWIGPVQIC